MFFYFSCTRFILQLIFIFFILDQLIEEDYNMYSLKRCNIKLYFVMYYLSYLSLRIFFTLSWPFDFPILFYSSLFFCLYAVPLYFSAGTIIITISADRQCSNYLQRSFKHIFQETRCHYKRISLYLSIFASCNDRVRFHTNTEEKKKWQVKKGRKKKCARYVQRVGRCSATELMLHLTEDMEGEHLENRYTPCFINKLVR